MAKNLQGQVNRAVDRTIQQSGMGRPIGMRQRAYFSTYHLHAATGGRISGAGILAPGDCELFVAAPSTNGQGLPQGLTLDQADTNFPGAGRMPDGRSFTAWELSLAVIATRADVIAAAGAQRLGPPHPDDVDNLLNGGVIVMKFLSEEKIIGPGYGYPEAGGLTLNVSSLIDSTAGNVVAAGLSNGGLAEDTTTQRYQRAAANSGNVAPAPGLCRRFSIPVLFPAGLQFSVVVRYPRPVQLRTVAQGGTLAAALQVGMFGVESFTHSNN